ncbi:MAG: hypothetical protein M3220_05185 [Chloroflexota bacterium]|nr:hypothetical protein [Chloroflexota bacterium]
MRGSKLITIVTAIVVLAIATATAWAQEPDATRHVLGDDVIDTPLEVQQWQDRKVAPQATPLPGGSANVELVGQVTVAEAEPGRISDVGALGNYAYLGAFATPDCDPGGVFVIDISDPTNPQEVGFINTSPGNFVGEGVQALHLSTSEFEGDVLVLSNEICEVVEGETVGGVSLYDITDPLNPEPLAIGAGDTDEGQVDRAHQIHSALAWQQGDRAFVILVDEEEALDVDIMEITDPRNPVLIAETGLEEWPEAQEPLARGNAAFLHDVEVRLLDGTWTMLLSYWDAGWILLNVNDPANPVFIGDTDYPEEDPLLPGLDPEGNAHQAEFNFTGEFFIGTDEDFNPFRIVGTNLTDDTTFEASLGSDVPLPETPVEGETVFVGRACNDDPAPPPATGENQIAVAERGACTFTEKVANVEAAGGYEAIIIMNSEGPDRCTALVNMGVEGNIPVVSVGRDTGFDFFDVPFDLEACLAGEGTEQAPIDIGTTGDRVRLEAVFDGWGYVHLFNTETLEEIDAYAAGVALDPAFATGFGNLTVHEVATDPDENLGYLAYYAAGFRVIEFGADGIREVGHFLAEEGNDFWGVEVIEGPDGETLILTSDRNTGLWIFRFTGEPTAVTLSSLAADATTPDLPLAVAGLLVLATAGWVARRRFAR